MKFLLRSCFVSGPSDDRDLTFRNFLVLDDSGLEFDVPEDVELWGFLRDFSRTHNHSPELRTIRSHFEALKKMEVVDRLEGHSPLKPLYRGDFLKRLEEKAEDRRVLRVSTALREADQILKVGIEFRQEKGDPRILKGPIDAVRYLIDKAHDVITPVNSARLSGEVFGDTEDFRSEYERVKNDPLAGIGQFVGIQQFDESLKGAKKGELWTHAAFTGGLKSTLMLNWAYNQAVYMGYDVCIFSLEMPYYQCRRILYAMHSMHGKFKDIRAALKLPSVGILYDRLRDGELTPAEETFLFQHIIPDFKADHYGKIHIEVADPNKSDFSVLDLQSKAELIYSRRPFQLLFVDHAGLMSPRKWVSSTTERLNEVIRDLKRLAMSFNRGSGMAIVELFQISREGFKTAEKIAEKANGAWGHGPYNLTHLSYANECISQGTRVFTSSGLLPVENVRVGGRVWSSSGWKEVLATFDQGTRPLWRIETDRGSYLEATDNHRVRVIREEQMDWCRADDLKVGDWVLASASAEAPLEAPSLPECENHPNLPKSMTRELSYLLGAWDGDGVLKDYAVGFTGNLKEQTLRDRLVLGIESELQVRAKVYHFPSRPSVFDIEAGTGALARWFEKLSGPRGKKVPEVIWMSPRNFVRAYLGGLFDTDGWINNQGVLGLGMKSEGFLRDIQLIMTSMGYDTHLSWGDDTLKKTGKTYRGWTLRLRGRRSLGRFQEEIGFTEPWKRERLASLLGRPVQDKQIYPLGRTFASLVREHLPYSNQTETIYNQVAKSERSGKVPRGMVERALGLLQKNNISDARADLLSRVLDLHVMQVRTVGPTGQEGRVFDLEVGGDHEYQTGPLLSHNCERSSDIVTASFVNDELRSQSKVLFQCLKSRDHAPFSNFFGAVKWDCRRILTSHEVPMIQSREKNAPEKNRSSLDDILNSLGT